MSSKKKFMTSKELVRAVSDVADVRADVVEDVINALKDVAMEEIVNKGKFRLHGLFSIKSAYYKGFQSPMGKIEGGSRLIGSVSNMARSMFKLHADKPHLSITRENWRERWDEYIKSPDDTSAKAPDSFLNEFLIDDE